MKLPDRELNQLLSRRFVWFSHHVSLHGLATCFADMVRDWTTGPPNGTSLVKKQLRMSSELSEFLQCAKIAHVRSWHIGSNSGWRELEIELA